MIQRNRFVYIKENFIESTKLSAIQRIFSSTVYQKNVSLIERNGFRAAKKLFSGCKALEYYCYYKKSYMGEKIIDYLVTSHMTLTENGNRKTLAGIPVQSKASFFPQKDFQIL